MQADRKSIQGVRSSVTGSTSDTRLSGRWLLLARIAWVVVAALSFGLFLLSLPSYAIQLHTVCTSNTAACYLNGALFPASVQALHALGVSIDGYVWYTITVTVLVALIWAGIGFVIFWHRSDDGMALLVALFLVTFNPALTGGPMASLVHFFPGWTLPVMCLGFLSTGLEGLFFYLFPNGHFVPRWMRWLFLVLLVQQIMSVVLLPNSLDWSVWLNNLALLTFFATAIFSQFYRYRHISTSKERQQTKWVLFGIFVFLVGGIVMTFVPLLLNGQSALFDVANDTLWFILLLPVPLSIGIAMLRSRLYDIDVLINRTLVYTILTAILTLTYVGLILILQPLTRALTGQAGDHPIVIVGSTLVIAALFHPLRRRTQTFIDRRFYRRKYDGAQMLTTFSTTLRQEVDLEQLREELATIVQETMQPSHISLWLRPTTPTRKTLDGLD